MTKAGGSVDRISVGWVVPQDSIAERLATQQIAGIGATWPKSNSVPSKPTDFGWMHGVGSDILTTRELTR